MRVKRGGDVQARGDRGPLLFTPPPPAQVTSTEPSFEEIALRLMEAGEPEAVHAFLAGRLETLGKEDRTQVTRGRRAAAVCGAASARACKCQTARSLHAHVLVPGPCPASQATMIATWLTELLLDQVNRALLQRGEEGGEHRYEQVRGWGRRRACFSARGALAPATCDCSPVTCRASLA